ncbi:hypothetical protein [Allohahella marinimesophila]|uniref:Uncharacterized protein n=1 Tax=Allohahella marinimesophila TaxID=1054972 RepID=A0ABP7Q7B1_9GAMM
MVARNEDIKLLSKYGLSVERLVSSAAEYLRDVRESQNGNKRVGLSEDDKIFFRSVGAHGVDGIDPRGLEKMHREMAVEYAVMVECALSSDQVAKMLGLSISRIRQRSLDKTLYSIKLKQRHRFPAWQFHECRLVRHIDEVLPFLNRALHPLAVHDFFTTPNSELEDEDGRKWSPVERLEVGQDIETIKHIIRFL